MKRFSFQINPFAEVQIVDYYLSYLREVAAQDARQGHGTLDAEREIRAIEARGLDAASQHTFVPWFMMECQVAGMTGTVVDDVDVCEAVA